MICDNIGEIKDLIIDEKNENNVKLSKSGEDTISLDTKILLLKKESTFKIGLKRKEADIKEVVQELCEELVNLKKDLKDTKDDLTDFKKRVTILEKRIFGSKIIAKD